MGANEGRQGSTKLLFALEAGTNESPARMSIVLRNVQFDQGAHTIQAVFNSALPQGKGMTECILGNGGNQPHPRSRCPRGSEPSQSP